MLHDLLFHPDYRAANPYQDLLYRQLAPLHPRPGGIAEALRLLDRAGPDQGVIFHLHWEDAVFRHLPDPAEALDAVRGFLAEVETFTARGGTLVWTVHNQGSHLGIHPELDRAMRRSLAGLADLVHVHSLAAARAVRAELGLPFARLAILPHGNYRPLHDPATIDRAAARAALGFGPDERVLLLFGRIDAYKGPAELIEAFAAAPVTLRLVIAGKQIVPVEPLVDALPADCRRRITLVPGFLPADRVASLGSAADAMVLPYRSILTSGTLLLALSLGRPVIAPDLPGLAELVRDGREALLHPPGELAAALVRFAALPADQLARMAAAAATTGELYDWDWIGPQMLAALRQAARHGRAPRLPPQGLLSAGAAGPG